MPAVSRCPALMRPLSRSPIRPLLFLALIAGSSLFAVAADARAADEAREGYERVSAVVTVEKAYGPQQNGCAVRYFLIWKKLANEDLEETFFGHYVRRGGEVTRAMASPFDDEGSGAVHRFSGAPADHHKQGLGPPSTAPHPDPGNTRDEDCDRIIERTRSDYEGEPSQIWVEVPVTDTVAPTARITEGPNGRTTKRKAAFRFRASEGSTFECRLTGKNVKRKLRRWRFCGADELARDGRKGYRKLKPGKKTFRVRATDEAGNRGAPAVRKWKVIRKRR